jgi:hypothetical protein
VSKCNYSNKIEEVISLIEKKDIRKWKQINIKDIVKLVTICIFEGNISLLRLDLNGRDRDIKEIFGAKRDTIISDTQLERIFSIYLPEMESVTQEIYLRNLGELQAKKGLRTLIIDGTLQAKNWCVIGVVNNKTPFFVGFESQEKRGKELVAADRFLRRLPDKIYNTIDLIVADGLYRNKEMFNLANDKGVDLFVKTSEARLKLIQETEFAYTVDKGYFTKNEYVEGYDTPRGCKYSIYKMEGLVKKGVNKPLTCYRVEEHYSKSGKKELFYCLTTATHLTLKQARKIAKSRWQIENNTFRNGSQQVKTKHQLFNSASTTKNYLCLIYLLMSLLWLEYISNSENHSTKSTFAFNLISKLIKIVKHAYANPISKINSS